MDDLLTMQDQPHLHQNSELIWHKQVSLNVSIFPWRLLRDRLPTKENLAKRGIISVDSRMCCAGCEHAEDLKHVFLICPYYGALWPLVRAWLRIEGVESQVISDHFSQFIYYAGVLKSRRSFFHLISLLCVWIIWNDQNDRLFRNKQSSLPQLLDKVKSYSLWWLKANNVIFGFGIHS